MNISSILQYFKSGGLTYDGIKHEGGVFLSNQSGEIRPLINTTINNTINQTLNVSTEVIVNSPSQYFKSWCVDLGIMAAAGIVITVVVIIAVVLYYTTTNE